MSDLELIIKRDSLNNKYLANYATDEQGGRWVHKPLVDKEVKALEVKRKELEEKVKQLDDEKRILMKQVEGLIKQSAIKEAAKEYLSAKNLALGEHIETIEARCKELEGFSNRTTINDANTTITGELEIIVKKD